MTWQQIMLAGAVAAPWMAAVAIFALGERRETERTAVGLIAGIVAAACALGVAGTAAEGDVAQVGWSLLGTRFALSADRLGALFAVVAAVLWLVTTVYATGYMSHGRDRARFFGFFSVCVGSAMGIALSANLLTLFVFYEALTLATYPLVVHSGSKAAVKGGRTYLIYALSGGTALALGVIWLYALGGGVEFGGGTIPGELLAAHPTQLSIIFALLIAGFGVKAALFPAHGWLPAAMVAPAPVSALLHAVAVVKAGAFGIARVVVDVYGLEAGRGLGLLAPLAGLAAFTIIFASVRALAQDDIKKRLAYSTIGQLSYIVLGLALGTPATAAAGVAHLAHHALLKITLFFTAGTLAEELKVYRVSQMDGVGRRMPLTTLAFSAAALGIIGVPPIAGFVTKWGLGVGALEGGALWPLAVLVLSSLLNAAYFMPMLGRAWFGTPNPQWFPASENSAQRRQFEGDKRMVLPLVLTALAGVAAGPLATQWWAPAAWAATAVGATGPAVAPWSASGWGIDATSLLFCALALVAWTAAAVASWGRVAEQAARFWTFFALAAAGSIALAFALEPTTFYTSFSVMALAAYGIVIHAGTPRARDAGRAYLAFTLLGETLLLAGLMIGSAGQGTFAQALVASPWAGAGIALLLVAFGIKIGAPILGGWMPSAYHATPVGAGGAIAGVVSSAGIAGLVRFAPGGVVGAEWWGGFLIAAGLLAALWGTVVGLVQTQPRHVLAYSSMSQFGLMTTGVGLGLTSSQLWPAAVGAVAAYLLHHGLAKAALFAGLDAVEDRAARWALPALALPALSLAGLPATSGAIAKVGLKTVAADAPEAWAHVLEMALPLAAVGTTLLVARFAFLAWRCGTCAPQPARRGGLAVRTAAAFGGLLGMVALLLWVWPSESIAYAANKSLDPHYLWILVWPILVGALIAGAGHVVREQVARLVGTIPPGDVWALALESANRAWERYQVSLALDAATPVAPASTVGAGSAVTADEPRADALDTPGSAGADVLGNVLARAALVESRLLSWPVASGAIVVLAAVVLALAW